MNDKRLSAGVSDLSVILQQKKANTQRFKVNHALVNQMFDEEWKQGNTKCMRTEYELAEGMPSVIIDIIGTNIVFRLTNLIPKYDLQPATYMRYFAEAAAFLVDNHAIVPPDAETTDEGEKLVFKKLCGSPYLDSCDWAIMELSDYGTVSATLLSLIPMSENVNPRDRDWCMLSNSWDYKAKAYKGMQALCARGRFTGREIVEYDVLEATNSLNLYACLLGIANAKDKTYLRRRLGKFVLDLFKSEVEALKLYSASPRSSRMNPYKQSSKVKAKDLLEFQISSAFSSVNFCSYPETIIKDLQW